jgi:hypothetical protein
MQNTDITNFTNSSGWHVIHNPDNMAYEIKSSNGKTRSGTYTHKRFADKALYDYLEFIQTADSSKIKKKRTKKVEIKSAPVKRILEKPMTSRELNVTTDNGTPATAEEIARYVNT